MIKKSHKTKTIRFIDIFKQILEHQEFADIINWDELGLKIKILDKQLLQDVVLPKFFKHGNYSSFLRQLNMYGFTSSKDQHGILSYEHPYFTKKRVDMKQIEKKKSNPADKNSVASCLFEYEELKNTIIQLQKDQVKIQQQLIKSIQQQQQCQQIVKNIIDKLLFIKNIQERRGKFFIASIRMLVKAMKPESQVSFQYLIKCTFPEDDPLLTSESNSIREDDIDPQYLTSPAPFGREVVENIGNYLNHKQSDFNNDDLEQVWFFGQNESDINFFGFEL